MGCVHVYIHHPFFLLIGSVVVCDEKNQVRIVNARNLPQMDKGSCDCYVRVKLAGKQYQTKPVSESLNPNFSSEFKFESRKDSMGQLVFEVGP